ncbi:uncharacterized protein V6R79_025931 [Siganus canaliculatus]
MSRGTEREGDERTWKWKLGRGLRRRQIQTDTPLEGRRFPDQRRLFACSDESESISGVEASPGGGASEAAERFPGDRQRLAGENVTTASAAPEESEAAKRSRGRRKSAFPPIRRLTDFYRMYRKKRLSHAALHICSQPH